MPRTISAIEYVSALFDKEHPEGESFDFDVMDFVCEKVESYHRRGFSYKEQKTDGKLILILPSNIEYSESDLTRLLEEKLEVGNREHIELLETWDYLQFIKIEVGD